MLQLPHGSQGTTWGPSKEQNWHLGHWDSEGCVQWGFESQWGYYRYLQFKPLWTCFNKKWFNLNTSLCLAWLVNRDPSGWLWEAWPFPSHLLLESGRRWCHAREIAQREKNVLELTWCCDNWWLDWSDFTDKESQGVCYQQESSLLQGRRGAKIQKAGEVKTVVIFLHLLHCYLDRGVF